MEKMEGSVFANLNPVIALGVVLTTGLTDAAYVMFTSAVVRESVSLQHRGAAFYICSHPLPSLATQIIGFTSSLRLSDHGSVLSHQ